MSTKADGWEDEVGDPASVVAERLEAIGLFSYANWTRAHAVEFDKYRMGQKYNEYFRLRHLH